MDSLYYIHYLTNIQFIFYFQYYSNRKQYINVKNHITGASICPSVTRFVIFCIRNFRHHVVY